MISNEERIADSKAIRAQVPPFSLAGTGLTQARVDEVKNELAPVRQAALDGQAEFQTLCAQLLPTFEAADVERLAAIAKGIVHNEVRNTLARISVLVSQGANSFGHVVASIDNLGQREVYQDIHLRIPGRLKLAQGNIDGLRAEAARLAAHLSEMRKLLDSQK